jgi:predicted RecB family nuclease
LEKDDISLLGGVNEKYISLRNNRGIFTINQLSFTFRPRKYKKAKNRRKRYYPELKALAIRNNQFYLWEQPHLNVSPVEIYLDIEGLPDENWYYLIGVIVYEEQKKTTHSFWAETEAEEKQIFEKLFQVLSQYDNNTIYHYGNYEPTALKKISKRYDNIFETEVNSNLSKLVDLLPYFHLYVYVPAYTNSSRSWL